MLVRSVSATLVGWYTALRRRLIFYSSMSRRCGDAAATLRRRWIDYKLYLGGLGLTTNCTSAGLD